MTDSERILWLKLKGRQILGVQFYRQKPIGEYVVDFYSSSIKMVIELDGGQHFEPEYIEKDKLRDEYLKSKGLNVLRFNNLDVLKNLSGVLDVIFREIEKVSEIPRPLLQNGIMCFLFRSSIRAQRRRRERGKGRGRLNVRRMRDA
jgi:very-short-patch-repair endonuclease